MNNIDTYKYKKEHTSASNRTACGRFNLSESLYRECAKRYIVATEEEAPLNIIPPNNVAEEVTAFLSKAKISTPGHARKDRPGQSGLLTEHTEALLKDTSRAMVSAQPWF